MAVLDHTGAVLAVSAGAVVHEGHVGRNLPVGLVAGQTGL